MTERLVAGLLLSIVIAGAGRRAGALTGRGAVAAAFIGTAVILGASWVGGLLLGAFFVSSSALSKLPGPPTAAAKGGRRDARQVLANGGGAALAALSASWLGAGAALAMIAGSLAAATADTWATEIGTRSGRAPRMLLSRVTVPVGVSGGITMPGTIASAGGAALIALVAAVGVALTGVAEPVTLAALVILAGIAGALLDSLLGELAQQRRRCDACDEWTEATVHRCGAPTTHAAGIRWVDNDVVNVACTMSGLVVAALGYALLR
ncbi:MAG TPA: DUF92 domain-containing protein [Thermomicrobiales bacterium]|nr:DUF92 domain-containing protein [Thermomicrobiales bacterium]